MGPSFPLFLTALAHCLSPVRLCIICDPFVVSALKTLEQNYLPGHLEPELHKNVMKRVEQAVKDFKDLPLTEDAYVGAVDEDTLEQASWSFLKDLKRITDSNVKGMMLQTLIWCNQCEKQVHACRKSMDCGGEPITHRAGLSKTSVTPEDEGNYRCELGTVSSGPATIIHFHVIVLPLRILGEKPAPNVITQGEEEEAPEPWDMEAVTTVANKPKPAKNLKYRLIVLLILGVIILGACIIAAIIHFRKARSKLKTSSLGTRPSQIENKIPELTQSEPGSVAETKSSKEEEESEGGGESDS